MGTNKGEKLNEPESDPSPICKKSPARMDSACRAPSGSDGLADLYLKRRCTEWSVYDIKAPREPFESIGSICSLIALAVL